MVLVLSCFAFSFILFLLGYTFLGFWGEIGINEFAVDVIKGGFFLTIGMVFILKLGLKLGYWIEAIFK